MPLEAVPSLAISIENGGGRPMLSGKRSLHTGSANRRVWNLPGMVCVHAARFNRGTTEDAA